MAIPGDTIEIKNKIVYVNGKAVSHQKIDGKKYMDDMDDKFINKNLSFYEKNSGLILFGGWLGLLPAIIIYFLLSFIINGFRSEK